MQSKAVLCLSMNYEQLVTIDDMKKMRLETFIF